MVRQARVVSLDTVQFERVSGVESMSPRTASGICPGLALEPETASASGLPGQCHLYWQWPELELEHWHRRASDSESESLPVHWHRDWHWQLYNKANTEQRA